MRNHFQPQNLCDIQNVSKISVSRDDEVHRKVDITLKDPDKEVMYTRGAKTYRDILLYISESGVDARGQGRGGVCVGAAGIFLPADGQGPLSYLHQVKPGRET